MKHDKLYFKIILMTFSVMISLSIFLPAYQVRDTNYIFTGYEISFGKEVVNFYNFAKANLKLNFLSVLAYFLPIIAGILLFFKKELSLISVFLFFISGIFFLFAPSIARIEYEFLNQVITQDLNLFMISGAILSLILSFFGFGLSLYYYLKLK